MLLLIPTPYEASLLFGESASRPLLEGASARLPLGPFTIEAALCGFGLAAAGAGAAHWIARSAAPSKGGFPGADSPRVLLIGLAGTYDEERAPVGGALAGTAVACDGIGVGEGIAYQNAEEAGWRQGHPLPGEAPSGDRLELDCPIVLGEGLPARGELLSVSAASAGAVQSVRRARLFPSALAEEMETFSVALAARLAGARLTAVRGISNRAGDRRKSHWRPEEAMAAAREALIRTLEGATAGASLTR